MLKSTKSNIEIFVASYPRSVGAIIQIGFKTDGNHAVLHQLNELHCMLFSSDGFDEACILDALYNIVSTKISHENNRVGFITCNIHDGFFYINIACGGKPSVINRIISQACSVLCPAKMYPKYKNNCEYFGEKPNKEYFAFIADKLNNSINSKILIVLGGDVVIKDGAEMSAQQKLDIICKKAVDSLNIVDIKDVTKTKPSRELKNIIPFPKFVIAKGLYAIILKKYIESKLNISAGVEIIDDKIICADKIYDKLQGIADENKITSFIAPLSKIKSDLYMDYMVYQALESGAICPHSIITFLSEKQDVEKLGNFILKSLK